MKYDACVVTTITSAGSFLVTSKPALFYGVSCSGSTAATVINVHNSAVASGVLTKIFTIAAPAAAANNDGPYYPVVCGSGISCTNIGTVTGYVVFYANIAR